MATTLYEAIKALGVPMDNHASDLYVKDTQEVRDVLRQHLGAATYARSFVDNVTGERWLDIPFAYAPWFSENVGTRD